VSGARDFVTLGALVVLVAGAVWLSAILDRRPQVTEATAAAIRAEMALFIETYADPAARKADGDKPASLCIASNEPLDFALLADRLAGTFLRAVPVADCTSKTVKGDFGMFASMTTWFDESGDQAGMGMIEIAAVHCPTARRCLVDIDLPIGGDRYEVERIGDRWSVEGRQMRWIV
jgi:hypothetical protein